MTAFEVDPDELMTAADSIGGLKPVVRTSFATAGSALGYPELIETFSHIAREREEDELALGAALETMARQLRGFAGCYVETDEAAADLFRRAVP